MFENINITCLYNKYKNAEKLLYNYTKIKNRIYYSICGFGVVLLVFSMFIGLYIKDKNIFPNYLNFINICVCAGASIMIFGLFLATNLEDNKKDYFPSFLEKITGKAVSDKLNTELLMEMAQTHTQIDIINFLNRNNVDGRKLKIEFASKNYQQAINTTISILDSIVANQDLRKYLKQEDMLIINYEQSLTNKLKPNLKLVD